MIYKDFQNLRLPMLGFGSMRLPLLPGGGDGDVDEAAVAEMVALAMERGANYFDTAYGYHNGNSERVMGRVLSRYPRESWLLASKFPGYDVSNIRPDRVEAIFEEQLEKCGVDYFDFYLFHNVYERNVGPYLDPDNRVLEYLLRQKEAGRIRHLGFSAHGSLAVIQRFLDAYGEYMEFGQLQLNYLDWDFQGARAKAEELNRRHIPIWVMEPLRGGRLARLSDGDAARLAVLRPEESMPGWAFRFLQGVPGVTMVLSGMSSLEQLRANLDTFETDRPLSEAEKAALLDVASGMVREQVLPCRQYAGCASLYRLPLLRGPLPPAPGHPRPAGPLQRAHLHRRRLYRPHGGGSPAGGEAARRLHRLPELRGSVPPAAQNLRSSGRLRPQAGVNPRGGRCNPLRFGVS